MHLKSVGSALDNELVLLSGQCICPGYTIIFECTVLDDRSGGTTVWQGTALDCESKNNEILLLHSYYTSPRGASEGCNNGAVVGRSVRVQGTHYVSQLYVTLTPEMISETVECSVDNGTSTTVVGSLSILPTCEYLIEHGFLL